MSASSSQTAFIRSRKSPAVCKRSTLSMAASSAAALISSAAISPAAVVSSSSASCAIPGGTSGGIPGGIPGGGIAISGGSIAIPGAGPIAISGGGIATISGGIPPLAILNKRLLYTPAIVFPIYQSRVVATLARTGQGFYPPCLGPRDP